MTKQDIITKLLTALEATLPYLPNCDIDNGEGRDCGPKRPYTPECEYQKARAVIVEVKGL